MNCGNWESINSECLLLPAADFQGSLINPPKTDRESLGWGSELKEKEVVFRYGKVGCDYWYHALIGEYNDGTLEHHVEPLDGSPTLVVNLLRSKKSLVKEWRFVQEGEDIETTLRELNE